MKTEIKTDETLKENYAVIYAKEVTKSLIDAKEFLESVDEKCIIAVDNGEKFLFEPTDIYYFYTENKKIFVKVEDGIYEVRYKIFELEEILPLNRFVKLSQGVIANIKKIRNVKVLFNGTMEVTFINGDKQFASRRSVSDIRRRLGV